MGDGGTGAPRKAMVEDIYYVFSHRWHTYLMYVLSLIKKQKYQWWFFCFESHYVRLVT